MQCSCEAGVCSCDRSRSCGYLKPLFAVLLAVLLAVVPGLKSPFALAGAVADDLCAAVAVVLAFMRWRDIAFAVALNNCNWISNCTQLQLRLQLRPSLAQE